MDTKKIISFVSWNMLAQVFKAAQEIGLRILFPPSVYGIWNFLIVLKNLGLSFDIGVTTAAARKIAIENGTKNLSKASQYFYNALIVNIVAKFLAIIPIIIYVYFVNESDITGTTRIFILASVSLMLIMIGATDTYAVAYQALQKHDKFGLLLASFWAIFLIISMLLGYIYGIHGLLVAPIFAYIIYFALLILRLRSMFNVRGWLDWNVTKKLINFGVPLRIVDYPMLFLMHADTLIVSLFFDLKTLAIYATAKLFFLQLSQIPGWIQNVFVMNLANNLHSETELKRINNDFFYLLLFNYLFLIPLILVLAAIASKMLIHLFLEGYIESLDYVLLLMTAIYFCPQVVAIRNYWILNKKLLELGITNAIALLIFFVLIAVGYAFGLSLKMIAGAYIIAYFFNSLLVIVWVGKTIWGYKKLSLLMLASFLSLGAYAHYAFHISASLTSSTFELSDILDLFTQAIIFIPLVVLGWIYLYFNPSLESSR